MGWSDGWVEPEHIGFIAGSPGVWRRMVFPFLAQGLGRQERCLYLTSLHTPSLIRSFLEMEGVDVGETQAQGRFAVLDAAQTYMPEGNFDPDIIIPRWQSAVLAAMGEGFAGLRVVADMTWISHRPPGWERLEEYETRVNDELFGLYPIKTICFYDNRLLDGFCLSLAARTHPVLVEETGGITAVHSALPAGREMSL